MLINRRFGELLGSRPEAAAAPHGWRKRRPLLERLARLSSRLAALLPGDLQDTRGVAEEIIALDEPDQRFLQFYTAPVQGEDGQETIGRIIALRDVTRERELDKMKTDFISVVSHELRTPLTSIKGYTDLLLSGATGETVRTAVGVSGHHPGQHDAAVQSDQRHSGHLAHRVGQHRNQA